jgi:hypothetical protein
MTTLYEQIYELALEKCAGDKGQADAFTEAFVKQAFWGDVGVGAAKAVGAGVAGLGLGLGIHGISSAISGMADTNMHAKFKQALQSAVSGNEMLRHAMSEYPGRVASFAETLYKFAPHVVCDPNVLSHLLVNAIQGESVDITTIKTISELENRYTDNRKNSLFSPKAYV